MLLKSVPPGGFVPNEISRSLWRELVEKVEREQPLTPAEQLLFTDMLGGVVRPGLGAGYCSNLVPWPDEGDLRDLAERARGRHHEKT